MLSIAHVPPTNSSLAIPLSNFNDCANSHERNFYNARLALNYVEATSRNLVFELAIQRWFTIKE